MADLSIKQRAADRDEPVDWEELEETAASKLGGQRVQRRVVLFEPAVQDHGISAEEAQAMDVATATMDNEQRFMQTASWADIESRRFAREWDQGFVRCKAQNMTKDQAHLHMAGVVAVVLEANAGWAREKVVQCFQEFGGDTTRATVAELVRAKARGDRVVHLLTRRARRLMAAHGRPS